MFPSHKVDPIGNEQSQNNGHVPEPTIRAGSHERKSSHARLPLTRPNDRKSQSYETSDDERGNESTPQAQVLEEIASVGQRCCTFCKKKFQTAYRLIRHIRTHTNERPFKCDDCIGSFRQRAHLKQHEVRLHGKHPSAPPSYHYRRKSKYEVDEIKVISGRENREEKNNWHRFKHWIAQNQNVIETQSMKEEYDNGHNLNTTMFIVENDGEGVIKTTAKYLPSSVLPTRQVSCPTRMQHIVPQNDHEKQGYTTRYNPTVEQRDSAQRRVSDVEINDGDAHPWSSRWVYAWPH
mmetsp:Transcript_23730/g.57486  ORF Transcript_23730/g.57486 Transcript_23730/m.57486 type:complete len:292 (+) Transcript_23730:174-1049(+)